MTASPARPTASFTAQERDLIRREFCRHFGQDPRIADGMFLRTWRAGERAGQPKVPPAVQTSAPMFASREALGLGYRSQRATRTDRIISKLRALGRKLGAETADVFELADCPKPRLMRQRTYLRLIAEAKTLVAQLWAAAPI